MDNIICQSCGVETFVCNCYPPNLRCGNCGVIVGSENTPLIKQVMENTRLKAEIIDHFGRFGEL